jgi:predicted phosphodiesterase
MFTFIHVSDLHIHRDDDHNQTVRSRLGQLRDVHFRHRSDAYLLLTGDITDDGRDEQYARADAAMAWFDRARVLLCPGNHDHGECGILYEESSDWAFREVLALPRGYPLEDWKRNPAVRVLTDRRGSGLLTVGLDSTLHTVSPHDLARGMVGEDQLAALDAILSAADASLQVRLVYLHHNPFETDVTLALGDAEALLDCLRGRVDVLCVGHSHRQELWQGEEGLPFILSAGALGEGEVSPGFRIDVEGREIRVRGLDRGVAKVAAQIGCGP